MKNLTLSLLLILPFAAYAQTNQSIMFSNPDSVTNKKPQLSESDKQNSHCENLRKKKHQLKGKPQRRWAISERIKNECEADNYGAAVLPITD